MMDIQFVFHFVINKYNWVIRDAIKYRMILKNKVFVEIYRRIKTN